MDEMLEMLDFMDYDVEQKLKEIAKCAGAGLSDWELSHMLAKMGLDFGNLNPEQQQFLISFLLP